MAGPGENYTGPSMEGVNASRVRQLKRAIEDLINEALGGILNEYNNSCASSRTSSMRLLEVD
jgi:hypothetical protein